jgi:hypothetical protein
MKILGRIALAATAMSKSLVNHVSVGQPTLEALEVSTESHGLFFGERRQQTNHARTSVRSSHSIRQGSQPIQEDINPKLNAGSHASPGASLHPLGVI